MADVLMLSVSGCRGIVGSSLSPGVVAAFAGSFAGWLEERGGAKKKTSRRLIVLGRDGRAGGTMVRDAAVAGLAAAGCDVIDIGVAMTPTVGVMTDHSRADAGIVLTASHNPQPWNGLKILLPGSGKGSGAGGKKGASACAPAKRDADAIIARFTSGTGVRLVGWDEVGRVRHEAQSEAGGDAVRAAHVGRIVALLRELKLLAPIRKAKFRVVLDSVNGSGSALGAALLEELNCSVAHLGCEETGVFSHTPEPTADNLRGLGAAVRKADADVGFAQDPDADRLAMIDERGKYIGEEYTLVLSTLALARAGALKRGAAIPVNLSTSRMIDDVASASGARVVRTAVGEANVVEAMKALKAPIGGEGNGGVIWPAVTYVRDSLSAMALMLGLMAASGETASALAAGVPAYAIEKRKVELADRAQATRAGERIAAHYAAGRIDTQDGVRVDLDEQRAWLHVRASNTEPIMRLIAEAPTAAEATALLDEAAGVIG